MTCSPLTNVKTSSKMRRPTKISRDQQNTMGRWPRYGWLISLLSEIGANEFARDMQHISHESHKRTFLLSFVYFSIMLVKLKQELLYIRVRCKCKLFANANSLTRSLVDRASWRSAFVIANLPAG